MTAGSTFAGGLAWLDDEALAPIAAARTMLKAATDDRIRDGTCMDVN